VDPLTGAQLTANQVSLAATEVAKVTASTEMMDVKCIVSGCLYYWRRFFWYSGCLMRVRRDGGLKSRCMTVVLKIV